MMLCDRTIDWGSGGKGEGGAEGEKRDALRVQSLQSGKGKSDIQPFT